MNRSKIMLISIILFAGLTTAFALSIFKFSVIAQINNNNSALKEEGKTSATKESIVKGGHGSGYNTIRTKGDVLDSIIQIRDPIFQLIQ